MQNTARLVNLTPHDINIQNLDGTFQTVWRDGTVARVEMISTPIVRYPLACQSFVNVKGKVVGLPEPVFGTVWIVSAMVREACPERKDLASPGELIRTESGIPTGCKGLVFNV